MKNLFLISLIIVLLIKGVILFGTASYQDWKGKKNEIATLEVKPDSTQTKANFKRTPNLTLEEKRGLEDRIESIKLAIDLNLKFNKKWQTQIFKEIFDNYFDQRINVLNLNTNQNSHIYNCNIGEYRSQKVKEQYTSLLEIGMSSFESALIVNYYMERSSIEELSYQLREVVSNEALRKVYKEQLETSKIHLNELHILIQENGYLTSLENLEIFFIEHGSHVLGLDIKTPSLNKSNRLLQ